jgi:hypothetical protein
VKKLILLLLLLPVFSCNPGPGPKDAVSFNDNIVMRQDTFYTHLDELVSLIEKEAGADIVGKKYLQILNYAENVVSYISEQRDFDADNKFSIASTRFFSSQIEILENEFAELLQLYKLTPQEISVESQNTWDSLMEHVIYLDSVAAARFLEEQHVFTEKYGITLREID